MVYNYKKHIASDITVVSNGTDIRFSKAFGVDTKYNERKELVKLDLKCIKDDIIEMQTKLSQLEELQKDLKEAQDSEKQLEEELKAIEAKEALEEEEEEEE